MELGAQTEVTPAIRPTLQEFPVNPFEQKLMSQGLNLDIPDRFKGQDLLKDVQVETDELSGLPVEKRDVRRVIATELGNCIREGKNWALVYSDVDNLKTANKKYGRQFGDIVIRYGPATISHAIEKANLRPEVKTIVTRQTGAADETIVFLGGLTDAELAEIKKVVKEAENPAVTSDPPFIYTMTTTVLDSSHEDVEPLLAETKKWLTENPKGIPFDFYQNIKDKADTIVGTQKIAKDLARLPVEQLLNSHGIHNFIDIVTTNLGDSRISSELLDVVCKFVSVQATLALKNSISNQAAYQLLLSELGVHEERLRQVKKPEELIAIFEDMFGVLQA